MNICPKCRNSYKCYEPFPVEECEEFEYKPTEIIHLFYGMSKTMQKSIIEIMKVTQGREEME